jgi:mannosyltransferase OCH1-like enzyme
VFVTDEAADDYVKKAFTDYPNIIKKYLGLTVPILKADLLRYLLLFDHGGIWFDLDVSCEGTPIDEWVPAPYKDDVGVVVGWEFDMGWTAPIVRQFATWTIMSKPKSPHIWQVIEDILDALELIESNHMPINLITLDVTGDVVNFSGPRRLTRSIYKSLGKILNREIGEDDMSNIIHPTLIGDVLVMPGRSFAAEVNMYEEEETQLPPKLVTHHYAGAWKNEQGGESI